MKCNLGILGISEGNGHPYSWSAIFNGYDPDIMSSCGFPVISEYLQKQVWPDACIPNANVTHIWTQDVVLSQHIAKAAFIPNVCNHFNEMVGQVDAVMLARDDSENHLKYAKVFLEKGVPIYIDKPVALTMEGLNQLYSLQQYDGQIFTCSALRYASEFKLTKEDYDNIGELKEIYGVTPKSWEKYAAHIIEPALLIAGENQVICRIEKVNCKSNDERMVSLTLDCGINVHLKTLGNNTSSKLHFEIIGSKGSKKIYFSNTFDAFKAALLSFMDSVSNRVCRSPFDFNSKVVQVLESGL